jgi:ATP-dependent DNA helicase RecG
MAVDPQGSVSQLKGVGPRLQENLQRLGIERLLDLLIHLPLRYQDRSSVTPLAGLRAGDDALVDGQVMGSKVTFGRSRGLEVLINDGQRDLRLRFFHFNKAQQRAFEAGRYVRAFGSVAFIGRHLAMAHPEYQLFDEPPPPPKPELVPVYPTTQGLGQARLRNLTKALQLLEWPHQPGTPFEKLLYLHQPDNLQQVGQIRESLALDELCAYYVVMKNRALRRRKQQATALPQKGGLGRSLRDNLAFTLTAAQARVIRETLNDLGQQTPMLRLIQGDVGSGKTIVAAFAAIRAIEHGCQTAVMAPTELLAEQHQLNFQQWLEPLGIRVGLLTGQMSAKAQRDTLAAIANGELQVVIGTHALFQEKVAFHHLALVIIDEQHRFGVHQRMTLQNKGSHPHQLVMTATPIPRTLTMTLYADMDVSVIDELPKGRQPITTHTAAQPNRPELIARLREVLASGQQAYWVCTLIEPSDEIEAMSAEEAYELLCRELPDFRVALLHGRMKGDEKVEVMRAFKAGEYHLLVATTVVEVGVDVPNATHMFIENAERLGLAQLHQLRGRVGRGQLASRCFLLFKPGVSQAGQHRLNALRESQDGFYLAEQDLKLRGPGDILGTRQSGEQSFKIADLGEDAHLMPTVVSRSEALMQAPDNSAEHQYLLGLLNTWASSDSEHLSV